MRNRIIHKYGLIIWSFVALFGTQLSFAQDQVLIQRTPDEGIQPRLLNDQNGDIHLLYFRKLSGLMPKTDDIYYRHYLQDQGKWSPQVRVSTHSYTHQDSIGRAGFAIDGDGRIHVVWYQTRPAQYFYTRSNVERTVFEPQRSIVMDNLEGVDAGADIAARGKTVAIIWAAGSLMEEAERTVYTKVSLDGGSSFGEEQRISDPAYGVCACCGLTASFSSGNELAVAYRSAVNGNGRHMQLLSANLKEGLLHNRSDYYKELHPLQQWDLSGCPVTTNDFAADNELNTWLVFESKGRIVQLDLLDETTVALVAEPMTTTRQKNPALAFNHKNEKLIVWGEAAGYVKGGKLKLQLFDSDGTKKSTEFDSGLTASIDIPDYSFPATAALSDGSFLVLY